VRQEDGAWADVDTTLVQRGGEWVPRAAAAEYAFSTGGAEEFAALEGRDRRGRAVRLGLGLGASKAWRTVAALAAPVASGDTVTYPGAVPGGDLEAGGLEARDGDGRAVWSAPAPRMCDSSVDESSGEPQHTALVWPRVETDRAGRQLLGGKDR
jgi:hypothetical protein